MAVILVTGAHGQVGTALRRVLPALGTVVATDLTPQSPDVRALDLSDLDAVARLVREVRPSVIVNPGAYTAVDKAETDEKLALRVNADAPACLAAEARKLGAALIHYSTDYVFDGSGDKARAEDAPVGPLSAYGRTKLAGEVAVRESKIPHLIVRTSWVVSETGHNFVKTMLRLGAEREELRVVSDQIGAPTSAALLAAVTAKAIQRGVEATSGTYHVACAGETSWHGFAEEIFKCARALGHPLKVQRVVPIRTEEYPLPAPRPRNSRLDCTKVVRTFGLTLQPWREMTAEVVARLLQS